MDAATCLQFGAVQWYSSTCSLGGPRRISVCLVYKTGGWPLEGLSLLLYAPRETTLDAGLCELDLTNVHYGVYS